MLARWPRRSTSLLADRVQPVLLRLVEPGAVAAADRLDHRQLRDRVAIAVLNNAARVADGGRDGEPGAAGVVQIRRLPVAHRRAECAGIEHHAAAGDQLFHLSADHVSGRYVARHRVSAGYRPPR